MKERFAKFRRKELIKMWRTLKTESGYRIYRGPIASMNTTLRELMDNHEERVLHRK
jgi:hypothetical protein